ncbi:MAG: L,D-transpeptidase [Salinisphaeraceae bacterium]
MSAERIDIDLNEQSLRLLDGDGRMLARYAVSTSKNGAGEQQSSFRTPRGRHRIRAKIGAGAAPGTVFRGRRPTGEIYSEALAAAEPGRDWILTRILWLCGEEIGRNRLGAVDTMRRYVYIHGSPDSVQMGRPGSIGCVRMHNDDIIELFDRVPAGIAVTIHEGGA